MEETTRGSKMSCKMDQIKECHTLTCAYNYYEHTWPARTEVAVIRNTWYRCSRFFFGQLYCPAPHVRQQKHQFLHHVPFFNMSVLFWFLSDVFLFICINVCSKHYVINDCLKEPFFKFNTEPTVGIRIVDCRWWV